MAYTSEQVWSVTNGLKYADGSRYKGDLDRFGFRSGFGTFKYPIQAYTKDDKPNTPTLIHWMEYCGEWKDDAANGLGILKRYRGDGTSHVEFDGIWRHGEPLFERDGFGSAC